LVKEDYVLVSNKLKIVIVLAVIFTVPFMFATPVSALTHYDSDSGNGATVTVTGWYNNGQHYYYKTSHTVSITYAPFCHSKTVYVWYDSNAYHIAYHLHDISFPFYDSYVSTEQTYYAKTRVRFDLYFLEFPLGWYEFEAEISIVDPD
jgi:hypothetical protein